MNTHGFELKSFGLEIVNDLLGYWTGLGGARGKRPDFLHELFCNLPLMRRTYDVELSI